MTEELKEKKLKQIIIIVISIICVLLIGILIGIGFATSKDNSSTNNEVIEDNDNEEKEDNDNEEKEDNDNEEKEDINIIDETTKKDLYFEILHYIYSIDLFNRKTSCKTNIITEACLDDVSKMEIIFYRMCQDSAFSESQYDEETSSFIHFAYFSTIRQYEKELFGTNKIEFPDGKEFGNLFCSTYEKMSDSYKISNFSSACSVNSNETSMWTFDREKLNNVYQNEDIIYVDIPYYYIYGNDLLNWDESIRFCTDETRKDCVEKMEKLDESKLKKARFTFDYTDNKLKFNSIEIFNAK